jgi:hypothetical protein
MSLAFREKLQPNDKKSDNVLHNPKQEKQSAKNAHDV